MTVSLRGGCKHRKDCLVFSFAGQLDAYSEKQFTDYVINFLNINKNSAIVDLTKIDFIDSSGLGALVQAAKKCKKIKRSFLVVGNARVIQTIKLVRLESFLNLVPDLPTALSKVSA